MEQFPVSSSILSASHLTAYLQDTYNFTAGTNCSLVRAGINHTYLVNTGEQKYVFRIYSCNWRTEAEIGEEIRLLLELKNKDIAVSYPLPAHNGRYIQQFSAPEGTRFAVLFSFAAGEKLHLVAAATHYRIGALMARLHGITEKITLDRTTYTPQVLLQDSMPYLEQFLPADTAEMHYMRTLQTCLLHTLAQADNKQLRNGAVHLDIWFDNINVAGDAITIFDFDFCGNGWLALDVAYYMMQLHNVEKYERADYEPKVAAFIEGYESVQPLTAEEKRLLPALGICLYFFYLGVQCRRYENWSNAFLNENYLKRYINGLVRRYSDIYKPGPVTTAQADK